MRRDRRSLIREYKDTPRPAGVYRVHNTKNGRSLVGSSANLPGILNRHRFALENGSHLDKELQADWNKLGEAAFEFEVLDELDLHDDPGFDPTDDLSVLRRMWTEKLVASGVRLYKESFRGL